MPVVAKVHSIVKSAILQTFAANLGMAGAGLVNSMLLARCLGAMGRGELAAALLWPPFMCSIFGAGIFTAITYFTAQRTVDTPVVVASAFFCAVTQSVIGVTAGYLLIPFLLHKQPAYVIACARLYLSIIPLSLFAQCLQSALQGNLQFASLNCLRSIVPAGYCLGSIVLIGLHHLSIRNIVVLHICLQGATLLIALTIATRMQLLSGLLVKRGMIASLFRYGTKVYAGDMTGNVNARFDQMLLAAFYPPGMLGLYVVAVTAASGPELFATAVKMVSSARIANANSMEERRTQLIRVIQRYFFLAIPFAVLLELTLPYLLPLLYGHEFSPAVWTAEILVFAGVVIGAANVLGGGAQAFGDPWLASRAQIGAAPITLVALLLLVPRLGIAGAGIASLLAYSSQAVIVVLGLRKHGLNWADLVKRLKPRPDVPLLVER